MTVLRDYFERPISREIDSVVKADDLAQLDHELEEYVITKEIYRNLDLFFDAYNSKEASNGVWISGFFGSGKSHLLKMLALLLENRTTDKSEPHLVCGRAVFLSHAANAITSHGA